MSRHNLAYSYRKANRYADALPVDRDTYDRRRRICGPFHPNTLTSLFSYSKDLVELDRGAIAIPLLDEALRHGATEPLPLIAPSLADLRLRYFEKRGDAAGCRRTAELWEGARGNDAWDYYKAAGIRAVAAGVTAAADPSPAGKRAADGEADKAVAWLRKAAGAGYTGDVRADKDFAAVGNHPGFREVVGTIKTEKTDHRRP
jgi:hypothetical protein